MNNNSVNPETQFEELVENYIDGSITEEHAQELLKLIQRDETRRNDFSAQLQMAQLLAIREGREGISADERFMALLKAVPVAGSLRKAKFFNWSRALVRIAALLMVVVGVSYVVKLNFGDDTVAEPELAYQQLAPQTQPPSEQPALKGEKTSKKPADDSTRVDSSKVKAATVWVPLKIEVPRPNFTGTPKDIRSANLETDAERQARQGGYMHPQEIAPASRAPAYDRMPPGTPPPVVSGENYAKIEENLFQSPSEIPLSTFSIDVDTASYSNLRRFLQQNQLPPADAVRIEELINYFEYTYAAPRDATPFSAAMALHPCPWNPDHQLLRVGLQGRRMEAAERRSSNLVFLLDVSGSMNSPDKLPLLITGMTMLVKALGENDRVAIVVYAGSSGLVLDSTSAAEQEKIIEALQRLSAGGSTAGGAGIELAYRVAADNYIKGGINRVILASDGDFNVGISSHEGLQSLIEQKRSSGIFLSVLGFGTGNLQDSKMELLANKGNGNYYYIDTEREAQKVLVRQLNATLVTIAKDVKIQIEFSKDYVKEYRLIGYENRKMAARDFDDDKKDAGEIGAGHQVTALYEIVPVGAPDTYQGIPLKYGKKGEKPPKPQSAEMLTLKLRYKEPEGERSRLLTFPLAGDALQKGAGDQSFRWAAAVAAFGQILRGSPHIGRYSLKDVRDLAADAKGEDPYGYRSEFMNLLERASTLKGSQPETNDKGYPLWNYRN